MRWNSFVLQQNNTCLVDSSYSRHSERNNGSNDNSFSFDKALQSAITDSSLSNTNDNNDKNNSSSSSNNNNNNDDSQLFSSSHIHPARMQLITGTSSNSNSNSNSTISTNQSSSNAPYSDFAKRYLVCYVSS